MTKPVILRDSAWPDEYQVDYEALEGADSETAFLKVAFELLKESSGLLILACGLFKSPDERGHDRNEAILRAHMVRMMKLMRTAIREIVDNHGGGQQMQIIRQFLDSASTLAYLLEETSNASRFDAYVYDSLIGEREFLKVVRQNIEQRGGQRLPIENRIERSIERTFQSAGVTEAELPSRRRNAWPNAQQRLALLGPTVYSAYRMGSGAIHGSWHDLERNHLEEEDGLFSINLEEPPYRPQPLFTMAYLAALIIQQHLTRTTPGALVIFRPRLEALQSKVMRTDELHEQFLVQRMTGNASG